MRRRRPRRPPLRLDAPLTIAADGAQLAARARAWSCPPRAAAAALGGRRVLRARGGHERSSARCTCGRDAYIGVAPLPGRPGQRLRRHRGPCGRSRDPRRCWSTRCARDPVLRGRFARARRVTRPQCLGPLAVESSACGVPGLLLAGDAAGFIDPMTGDGLRFALRGAELAAARGAPSAGARRCRCTRPARSRPPPGVRRQVAVQPRAALAGRLAARGACGGARREVGAAAGSTRRSATPATCAPPDAPASSCSRIVFVPMVLEARRSNASRPGAARGGRRRAARRRLRDHADCVSAVLPAADRRGRCSRPRTVGVRDRRRRGVRARQGAQVLGDCDARTSLDVSRPRAAVFPRTVAGPYRFLRHPNYVAVAGEIAGVALMAQAPVDGSARADLLRGAHAASNPRRGAGARRPERIESAHVSLDNRPRVRLPLVLDWLVLVLASLSLYIASTGGSYVVLAGIRLSARNAVRPGVIALVLAVVASGACAARPIPREPRGLTGAAVSIALYRPDGRRRHGRRSAWRRSLAAAGGPVRRAVLCCSFRSSGTWTRCRTSAIHCCRCGAPDGCSSSFAGDPRGLFDANIFYPEPLTLTYSDSMLLPGLTRGAAARRGRASGDHVQPGADVRVRAVGDCGGVARGAADRIVGAPGSSPAIVFGFYPVSLRALQPPRAADDAVDAAVAARAPPVSRDQAAALCDRRRGCARPRSSTRRCTTACSSRSMRSRRAGDARR